MPLGRSRANWLDCVRADSWKRAYASRRVMWRRRGRRTRLGLRLLDSPQRPLRHPPRAADWPGEEALRNLSRESWREVSRDKPQDEPPDEPRPLLGVQGAFPSDVMAALRSTFACCCSCSRRFISRVSSMRPRCHHEQRAPCTPM
eukprot:scaffold187200_cov33-Tisochrysis_lutea.AAC.2